MPNTEQFNEGFNDTRRWREWCSRMLTPACTQAVSLDLFCGAGGLGLGMSAAGLTGGAIDKDADSLLTHADNVAGPSPAMTALSSTTDWSPWRGTQIIMGGPPCQPFSGHGKQAGSGDSRNGFPAFLAAVEALRPSVAVAENVRGVLYRNREYFESVANDLKRLGYSVDVRLLKAEHYGVPQRRERVFLAAWRTGCWEWPVPFVNSPVASGVALGEGINRVRDDTKFLTPAMDVYVARYEKASSCRVPRDLDPARPSRTVTTRNLGSATSDMLRIRLPDGRRRMLTLEEGALLQGFPENFKFKGGAASVARQIGNAVPPLMGLAVAHSALRALGI